ncbi:MAG: SPOR domain-containing protein [Polyangiaceae bacterium]
MRWLLAALVVVSVVATARAAHACWDGYLAASARVAIGVPGDPEWSPARARDAATWLVRVEALLPRDVHVRAFDRDVWLCRADADGRCDGSLGDGRFDGKRLVTLFRAVARLLRAGPAKVARARALRAHPVTVQVLASRDPARAEALAQRLNDEATGRRGFLDAGGFPSNNARAHVLDGRDARGAAIHRVVVGAFLHAADASDTLDEVGREAGLRGLVRAL